MTRFTALNLDFNRGGDVAFLAHETADSDVLIGCEGKDVDVADALPDGWATTQEMGTEATHGSFIARRISKVRLISHELIPGSPAGGGTLARHIAKDVLENVATGKRVTVFAGHAPKLSTGVQDEFYATLKQLVAATAGPVVVGVDFNRPPAEVAALLKLDAAADGVIGVLHSHILTPNSEPTVDRTGIQNGWTDHPTVSVDLKDNTVTIPNPYGHSTFHGKLLDNASIASLKLAEARLGYDLTIVQGIGGAAASAGTHTEGRAVDLAPFDRERKLRVLKDLGWAAWYRPTLPGVWGAHIHGILIFEDRDNSRGLADVGFRQIAAFDARRDGLKSNLSDPSYRPSPRAVFTRAEYEATFMPRVAPVPATPRWDDSVIGVNDAISQWRTIIAKSPGTGAARDAQECINLTVEARAIAKARSTKF